MTQNEATNQVVA